MALKALLSFQPLRKLTRNPFTHVKGFSRCRGSVNLVEGVETLGRYLGADLRWGMEGSSTLELSLNIDG